MQGAVGFRAAGLVRAASVPIMGKQGSPPAAICKRTIGHSPINTCVKNTRHIQNGRLYG